MTDKKTTVAGVDLTKSEIEGAKKDGVLEAIQDGGKLAAVVDSQVQSDLNKAGERQAKQVPADLHSTFLAPLLDLSKDELERRLTDAKAPDPIPHDDARGLLALERSGKNRTGYVKMLMKVIDVKSPYEVTTAGPAYTNDETSITDL